MPTLSILIPALNEEKTISHAIERVLAVDLGQWIKEIIVVNDGSTDGTEAAVQSFGDQVRYLKHSKNLGKGQAIKTALAAARGEYVIMQDADLEYDPADIAAMTKLVDKGRAEVTAKLLKRKYRISEVPITYSPRTFAAGKKINWLDGLKGLLTIIRYAV